MGRKLNVQRRGVEETGGRIRRSLFGRRVGQDYCLRQNAKSLRKSGATGFKAVSSSPLAFLLSSEILQRTNAEASCDQHQRQPRQQQPPDGPDSVCASAKEENRL